MATSNQKIIELREQLPALIEELVGDSAINFMGIPLPVSEIVPMVMPLVDAEIAKLASTATAELDEQLRNVADFVTELRSDRHELEAG